MLLQEVHQRGIVEVATRRLLLWLSLLDHLLNHLLHRLLHRGLLRLLLVEVKVLFRLLLLHYLLDGLLDGLVVKVKGLLRLLLLFVLLFRLLLHRRRVIHHQIIQVVLQIISMCLLSGSIQAQEVILLLHLLRRSLFHHLLDHLLDHLLLRRLSFSLRRSRRSPSHYLLHHLLSRLRSIIDWFRFTEIVGVVTLLLKSVHHLRFLEFLSCFLQMRKRLHPYTQLCHHFLAHVRGTSTDLLSSSTHKNASITPYSVAFDIKPLKEKPEWPWDLSESPSICPYSLFLENIIA